LVVLAVLLATGCGDATTTSTTSTTSATTTTIAETTTSTPTDGAVEPDVQAAIGWFVSLLNGTDISAEEYETRFGEEFRAQVPFDTAFQTVLEQFRPLGPFNIVETNDSGTRGDAIIEAADGTRLRVLAEVDANDVITTLLIQPTEQPQLEDPPATVDEAFSRLSEIGELHAITAEVTDGVCTPIAAISPDESAPLGSAFKLYVLAALGEAIAAGDIDWEDDVTIRDELKSIPTGILQDRSDGDVVSVLEAAQLMISISDNTAADLLIDLLGRETIETTQTEYGNSAPERNTPFLTTREFAALKIGPGSGLRDPQWIEGDEAARRSLLAQLADITADDLPITDWVDPIDPDLVEWFASPSDLCTLAIRMGDLVSVVPEIGDILEINPGVPADETVWDRIWFKGGSEPGLVAVWWVTEVDGRVFVTAGSVVDPDTVIDTNEAVLLFAAVRDLLSPR
jgi:beta-lactamase class A